MHDWMLYVIMLVGDAMRMRGTHFTIISNFVIWKAQGIERNPRDFAVTVQMENTLDVTVPTRRKLKGKLERVFHQTA